MVHDPQRFPPNQQLSLLVLNKVFYNTTVKLFDISLGFQFFLSNKVMMTMMTIIAYFLLLKTCYAKSYA